jgi:hypothetical protein
MTFKEKLLTSLPPIEVAGRRLKRYYVTSETAPVTPDIGQAATELLPKLAPDADGTPPAGFIVLDRPWIGCVWELPPIHHERNAWVRHILRPDLPNLAGYLADSMPPGPTR